jgi:riboflavin-specific deaminase-like protein
MPKPRDTRPYVVVNMAMTADGKVATAGHEVTGFGSPRDLEELYALRASADCVMSGARTVEENRATLGNGGDKFTKLRRKAGLAEAPLRVLVTGRASFSPEAEIWKHRFSPIIVLTTAAAPESRKKRLARLADHLWESPGSSVDLEAALRRLAGEFSIRRLVCEGGGELNAAMNAADLIDEFRITLTPRVFAGGDSPTIADGKSPDHLVDARRYRLAATKRIGDELFLRFVRNAPPKKRL